VREWGDPAGREILFIHGVAQSHLSFVRQMGDDLARNHRIVAYDTRGHGASDKPVDAAFYHDPGRWADEVQAVIEAKQLRRPVLVGWSMGGRIIGQYLAVHGDARLGGSISFRRV
jgi:non-heme chloroperoxidase